MPQHETVYKKIFFLFKVMFSVQKLYIYNKRDVFKGCTNKQILVA